MKLTPQSLENAALYYLQRYAATRASLRRVLLNKIRKMKDADPARVEQIKALIEPLIERYVTAGLLNDTAFAEARTSTLRRRGGSARAIAMKLSQKGVDRKVATEVAAVGGREAEVSAARELCRRKKLGAFRVKLDADPDRKRKDIAVLARAGFRYDVIKEALSATS